jgi:hypothetical protein
VQITDPSGCVGTGNVSTLAVAAGGGICSGVVLAVNLTGFAAQKQSSSILLSWAVAASSTTRIFGVERSTDGSNWVQIGSVKADAGQRYSFTDNEPNSGANYYRLKLVSANGSFGLSQVLQIVFAGTKAMTLYPNPATDYVYLDFSAAHNGKAQVVIESATGGAVYTGTQAIVAGVNHLVLNQVRPLAQGTYMIKLITDESIYTAKFIKAGK